MTDQDDPAAKADSNAARDALPPEAYTARLAAYWRVNLLYLACLLSVWSTVSFGCGVIFVDELNQFRLPGTGFKLGFWFAQQGSIYTFVLLIFVYVWLMNRLDAKFGFDER